MLYYSNPSRQLCEQLIAILRLVFDLYYTFISIQKTLITTENNIFWILDEQKYFDTWDMMREWYYKGGMEALRRFCQMAHKEAGMGEVNVRSMITYPRTLNFRNKKYFPSRFDVVRYEIEESGVNDHGENPFFITRGRKPDCVYYLEQWQTDPHRFHLTKHVCGIYAN